MNKFIKKIERELKETGVSNCFTHAHLINERKKLADIISINLKVLVSWDPITNSLKIY